MQQPYEKVMEVGKGAFGRCFLCKKPNNTFVVLKKICDNNNAVSEARILSQLDHKNIVKAHETYRSANSIYIVLEYLEGGNLAALIKKNEEQPFSNKVVRNYCQQLAEALRYIHDRSIVHRDVKPANVLLNKDCTTAKLADFGISVQLREGEMIQGKVGTSAYMSPEMLEGREYDYKCDVWALGCVLYELAEGQRAFPGSTELAVQYKICSGTFVLPSNSKFKKLISLLLSSSASARPTAKGVIQELIIAC